MRHSTSHHPRKLLGSFYTPPKTVAYMVSRLALDRECVTLEPACGTGHFLEELYRQYLQLWQQAGCSEDEAAEQIIRRRIVAFEVDESAAEAAALRLRSLSGSRDGLLPNVFVRDTLDMAVEQGAEPRQAEDLDRLRFDRIIGNPPYGRKPSASRLKAYQRRYRRPPGVHGHVLGSNDLCGFFVVNAIERSAEGGLICLLVSDTILSIPTHEPLRRLLLDTCKVREVVLAPPSLFRTSATSRTCILTLEKATGEANREARRNNVMRLVDRLASEEEYSSPPPRRVQMRRQAEYERVRRAPFFVGVHDSILDLFDSCPKTVGDVVEGGAGLQTGDNYRFSALLRGSLEANQQARRAARAQRGKQRRLYPVIEAAAIVDLTRTSVPAPGQGFADDGPCYVPFVRGSSQHQYFAPPDRYVDYSRSAVAAYRESPSAHYANVRYYFRRGLVTNAQNRMLRATLIENAIPAINTNVFIPTGPYSLEYLLGLLNSRLATYLCTKIINMSIGGLSAHPTPEDIRLLPFAEPTSEQAAAVETEVAEIIRRKQADPHCRYPAEQGRIDQAFLEVYRLPPSGVAAVNEYWQEVLAEQIGRG